MNRPVAHLTSAIALAFAAVAVPAWAKDAPKMPEVMQRLAACQSIAADADRLACYDRESKVLIASANQGDIRVIDRDEAKTMRRTLFGFALPNLGLFGGGDDDTSNEEVKVLDSTITSLTAMPRGRWLFTIAEGGARWETLEAPTRLIAPKVGQKVQLEKAALGSYWIRFNGQMGVKGHRVN